MSTTADGFDGTVVAANRNALRELVSAQLEGQSPEQIEVLTDLIVQMADAPPVGPDGALHQLNGAANGDVKDAIAKIIEAAQRNTNGHHLNGGKRRHSCGCGPTVGFERRGGTGAFAQFRRHP